LGYDPELSMELLAEMDYPDGFGVKLYFRVGKDELAEIAAAVVEYLAQIGVDAGKTGIPLIDLEIKINAGLDSGETMLVLRC
jgi:ABC-type transport system substrate-binding protein